MRVRNSVWIRSTTADDQSCAAAAAWVLSTTDRWTDEYFKPTDLQNMDRNLFRAYNATSTPRKLFERTLLMHRTFRLHRLEALSSP
jgi:hypothetical protein